VSRRFTLGFVRVRKLTPSFSPVLAQAVKSSRFNGFKRAGKPLTVIKLLPIRITGLKPGVNE